MRTQLTIAVDAPPEQVFATYTDPDLVPRWRPAIAGITDVSGPMAQVGTTFVTRYRGRTPKSRGQVVASRSPYRHTIAGRGAVAYKADVRLAEAAGATELTFELEVHAPGGPLGRVAERLFIARKVERETREEFARLKALVEAGQKS
jgi:uncharacterized protein YndB with AHSA1/START domain